MKLKPCPACGGETGHVRAFGGYGTCSDLECGVNGPANDPDGAKWNAMPRRGDADPGISDGELIARAIVNGFDALISAVLAVGGASQDALGDLLRVSKEDGEQIDSELSRRSALREQAKGGES